MSIAQPLVDFERPATGWASNRAEISFWALMVLGTMVMVVAWVWFGVTHEEEMSEQSKAIAAGTTMAGFGALMGGIPLVAAHVL